jgi:hypothetical protein
MAYVIKVKGKNSYWVQDVGFRRFVPEAELEERQKILKYKSKSEAEKDLIAHAGVHGKEKIFKTIEIVKESVIKLKQVIREVIREEIEKFLYKVNYKDGTSDYVLMTNRERTTMPYGNVKDVGGLNTAGKPNMDRIPKGIKLTSYEDMRKKAKKKLKEVHYTSADLSILYSDIANFVESEYNKLGNKVGTKRPIEMYDLLVNLFGSPKVSSKIKK